MRKHNDDPAATGQAPKSRALVNASYRRSSRRSGVVESPSVKAAARALAAAVERHHGLQYITRIVVDRLRVGAIYIDDSSSVFAVWRSEDDALRGIIPDADR